MIEKPINNVKTPQERLREHEEYIEKKVNALSIYNAYWCLLGLRSRGELPTETILKNDSFCKLQLIRVLKQQRYDPRSLNIFLEVSAENSIPLSYVRWIHEDKRAALWLNIVLKKTNMSSHTIFIESDIEIFVHDIIFNKRLLVLDNQIVEESDESQIALKKMTLELLRKTYILSKINPKDVKWLTSNSGNKIRINHSYRYMQKTYDLNNLKKNKEEKKGNRKSKKNANKDGYKQALVCTDTIAFKETDTTMQLCHILASLDYWMFDTYWFYEEGNTVDKEKADNRRLFIKNMYEAWNAKQNRDRDKIKKDQGIDLTSDNKKKLTYLAKACGKIQREVLNDLVESAYSQMRGQDIQLASSFPNQYASFDKIPLEQPYNSQSENSEEKSSPEETSRIEDKEELNSTYAAESVRPSTYSPSAFFDKISQTQSSGLPSGDSEREIISEDISSIKGQEEPSRSYDTDLAISSTCNNEKPPTDILTSKQKFILQQALIFEGNSGKKTEDVADANTDGFHKL